MKKHLRHLALLLAVLMLFTVLPTGVCAREESPLSIEGIRSSYRDNTTYFEVDFKNISGKPVSDIYPIPLAYDADLNYAGLVNTIQRHKGTLKPGETVTLKYSCSGKVFALGYDFLFYTDASGNTASVLLECILVPANASVPSEEEEGATFSGTTFSAGIYHSVFIWPDGTVGTVGFTSKGRCDVEDWSDIIAVSAASHTVGLRADGTVVAVGPDSHGQCDVERWEDITAVATGNEHTVGLRADGTVVATGRNEQNRCDVSDWKDITAIAAGARNTYGIKANGTVVAAGSNARGQRNIGSWSNITAISAGYDHVVGLKDDGTVIAVGSNDAGQCDVKEWTDIVAISANYMYTLGLKKDGTVLSTNEEEIPTSSWQDIIAISAGQIHAIGQQSDGTLVATGDNGHGRCNVEDTPVAIATGNKGPRTIAGDVVQVEVSEDTVVVLRTDGTVRAIGDNSDGQCNVEDWQNIVKIWAREGVTFGRTKDGRILSTSERYSGLTDIADLNLSPYDYDPRVGIKYDGTVVPMGIDETDPENKQFLEDISEWENITKAYAGGACILGLCEDGSVKITGWKACQDNKPKDLGWKNIKDFCFEMYTFTTYAVAETGEVYCWKPDSTTYSKPVWKNVSKLVSGDFGYVYGLTESGKVFYGTPMEEDYLEDFDQIVDLRAHSSWAMGLKEDGTVVFWDDYEQKAVTGAPYWEDIRCIKNHGQFCAGLKADGTLLYSSGMSVNGKTNVITSDSKVVDFWPIMACDVVYLTEEGRFFCADNTFSAKETLSLTADVKH